LTICALLVLTACSGAGLQSSITPDSEYYADTFRKGHVDVVCLQGMNSGQGPDTLFGCLLAAREQGLGTVELPEGVYLGHVAEFIVRSLKYYEIEERFERFYGYRFVLNFREASVRERKQGELDDYSGMLLGTAGELAMAGAGVAAIPLTPVIFAYKAVRSDLKRQDEAKRARALGLPEPTRGGVEVALRDMGDSYGRIADHAAKAVGMQGSDPVGATYVVETCYLEKPGVDEILLIAGQMKEPASNGQGKSFP